MTFYSNYDSIATEKGFLLKSGMWFSSLVMVICYGYYVLIVVELGKCQVNALDC